MKTPGSNPLKLSPNIGNWLEAAYYENLVVSNNIIRNGKIASHFGKDDPAQIRIDGCRTGLVFCDNTIEYSGHAAMIISDLDGGILRNNTFKCLDGPDTGNSVVFESCTGLEISK